MGQAKNWTKAETEYLSESWGNVSLKTMAKKLGRTEVAVKLKARRLGLGAFLDNGDYVSFNQLLLAVGKSTSSYTEQSWIEARGFPVKYKRVDNCRFKIVYLKDFWEWAERHKSFINWSAFEKHSLGEEPEWVDKQRKICQRTKVKYRTSPWTKLEDDKLIKLLKENQYTVHEISQMLGRTAGAVACRWNDLRIKDRPIKAENHNKWSDADLKKLCDMIKQGFTYELMAEHFGRSSKAIRGRIYWMYLTENLDKARAIIGDGEWGDNRPERPITHNTLNAAERREVKANISRLAGILREVANGKR